jgi:predicted SAM-dependent methyltransferase
MIFDGLLLGIKRAGRPLIQIFRRRMEAQKWSRLSSGQSPIKLELGAGGKKGVNGWTTVDLGGADIAHDLKFGIPLQNESVEAIYSSHLLEHLNHTQLLQFLAECRRVLVPGGTFRASVPNARLYLDCYFKGVDFKSKSDMHPPAISDTGSRIDQVNYIAYMNEEHKYLFDEENLVNIFLITGYSKSELSQFDIEIDPEDRRFESIYCIASK